MELANSELYNQVPEGEGGSPKLFKGKFKAKQKQSGLGGGGGGQTKKVLWGYGYFLEEDIT